METMTKLKFVSKISSMGKDTKIVWIPKRFHETAKKLEDKQIRVVMDDEI